MIAKEVIINKVVEYVNNQLGIMSVNNPMVMLARPFISRAMNNYISKFDKFLTAIQDSNGMVDIEGIIDEEINNLAVMQLQKYDNFDIGRGEIKFNIPIINKSMVITTDDIADFKQMLLSK